MEKIFVKTLFDLHCKWEGIPPIYRIYVNDELFTERTWIWDDCFLTEVLQIEAVPGEYKIRLESVGAQLADFYIDNPAIANTTGRAKWNDKLTLVIENAST